MTFNLAATLTEAALARPWPQRPARGRFGGYLDRRAGRPGGSKQMPLRGPAGEHPAAHKVVDWQPDYQDDQVLAQYVRELIRERDS